MKKYIRLLYIFATRKYSITLTFFSGINLAIRKVQGQKRDKNRKVKTLTV